jgi:predicted dehydrogenase
MLPIGVIGAGTEWEAVWQPAFSIVSRLSISAFYDPIAARGERLAESQGWRFASAMRSLMATRGLRGVVVLDPGWHGSAAIALGDAHKLPSFVSPRETGFEPLSLADRLASGETLIQPELRRRYTPATMRLRELTATTLGPIRSLRVERPKAEPLTTTEWAEAIDWCRFVVQSGVESARAGARAETMELRFRKTHEGVPVTAEICRCPVDSPPEYPQDFAAEVMCEGGVAIVTGNRRVRWKSGDRDEDEELSEDRTSAVVQLDLFARRLAGGLVPVATLKDVETAVQLARSAIAPL